MTKKRFIVAALPLGGAVTDQGLVTLFSRYDPELTLVVLLDTATPLVDRVRAVLDKLKLTYYVLAVGPKQGKGQLWGSQFSFLSVGPAAAIVLADTIPASMQRFVDVLRRRGVPLCHVAE